MKKMVCAMMALVMLLGLVGCGKSPEERIVEAMMEEPHKDKDTRVQLEEKMPEMIRAYESYTTSCDGSEILTAAETFNRIHAECVAVTGDKDLIAAVLTEHVGRCNPIGESIYRGKAALANAQLDRCFDDVDFYFNTQTGDSKFVCSWRDDDYQLAVLILNQDGSVYIPDLSMIRGLEPSSYNFDSVTADTVIMGVIDNAEWLKFAFSLQDPASTGQKIAYEQPDSGYACWKIYSSEVSEFNAVEQRQIENWHYAF